MTNKKHHAQALAVWGTTSDAGKSLVAAGLCRLLKDMRYRVAPFKAQNMSLNSAVTVDGGEIGRAQACQAEACGIPPTVDMNPLLLKPTGETCSQVVLRGRPNGMVGGDFGMGRIDEFKSVIAESYDRLAESSDIIVIEGAGSCAELNLRERDLANAWISEYSDAKVLLVADIERGGVFASLLGTLDLLKPNERARVVGIIVNKFRGAIELFDSGRTLLEERSGVPVLGVLPYMLNHGLPDEDGSFQYRPFHTNTDELKGKIHVGVIVPQHIANATDFDALSRDTRFVVSYLYQPVTENNLDILVLPGSKNVISDLIGLRKAGFAEFLKRHAASNKLIIGICGGYQMLGERILDPDKVEGHVPVCPGFGSLNIETRLFSEKCTVQVEGRLRAGNARVFGYEIHCGKTSGPDTEEPLLRVTHRQDAPVSLTDGAVSPDGNIWGTYVHGLFDSEEVRDVLAQRFGITETNVSDIVDSYDYIGQKMKEHLNIPYLLERLGI
ncbi:MAG: cobyric acid synthase [bacterium]